MFHANDAAKLLAMAQQITNREYHWLSEMDREDIAMTAVEYTLRYNSHEIVTNSYIEMQVKTAVGKMLGCKDEGRQQRFERNAESLDVALENGFEPSHGNIEDAICGMDERILSVMANPMTSEVTKQTIVETMSGASLEEALKSVAESAKTTVRAARKAFKKAVLAHDTEQMILPMFG